MSTAGTVLVCGGRDFVDRALLNKLLDILHQARGVDSIVTGAADGADTLAIEWAKDRGVPFEAKAARWKEHGRSEAGRIRNREMLCLTKPTTVLAIPGANGTADMIRIARAAGVRVLTISDILALKA